MQKEITPQIYIVHKKAIYLCYLFGIYLSYVIIDSILEKGFNKNTILFAIIFLILFYIPSIHLFLWRKIKVKLYKQEKYAILYKDEVVLGKYSFDEIITAKAKFGIFLEDFLLDMVLLLFLANTNDGQLLAQSKYKFCQIDDSLLLLKVIKKSPYYIIWFSGFLLIGVMQII